MFRVGQKVVCVDDTSARFPGLIENGLVKGRIYTVSDVGLTHPHDARHLPCIRVVELHTTSPLWAHRFRPVVERKTDIGFAHEILRKVTRKNRVRA